MHYILSLEKSPTKSEYSDSLWFSSGHLEPQIRLRIKILTVLNARHLWKRNTLLAIEIMLCQLHLAPKADYRTRRAAQFPVSVYFLNTITSNKITSQVSSFPDCLSLLKYGCHPNDSALVNENRSHFTYNRETSDRPKGNTSHSSASSAVKVARPIPAAWDFLLPQKLNLFFLIVWAPYSFSLDQVILPSLFLSSLSQYRPFLFLFCWTSFKESKAISVLLVMFLIYELLFFFFISSWRSTMTDFLLSVTQMFYFLIHISFCSFLNFLWLVSQTAIQ